MSARKSGIIDGFTSVQAVKHAAERGRARARTMSAEPEPQEKTAAPTHAENPLRVIRPGAVPTSVPPSDAGASGPHPEPRTSGMENVSGVRTMPSRRTVVCYVCGYSHTVTGMLRDPFCPKCKSKLKTGDVMVSGPYSGDVETIGDVRIMSDARFDDGAKITGRCIFVSGDVSNTGSLNFMEKLVLRSGCKLRSGSLGGRNTEVEIASGESVVLDELICENLLVNGHVKSSIQVSCSASISAGGFLEGSFSGPALRVEDGAGLIADVHIERSDDGVENPHPARAGSVLRNAVRIIAFFLALSLGAPSLWR